MSRLADLSMPDWTKGIEGWVEAPNGLILAEDVARLRYGPPKHPQAGDIFSGCGGASLGFKQAGFHVRFAVEWDPAAAFTYMINLGSHPCQMHFETAKQERAFEKMCTYKDPETGLLCCHVAGESGVMEGLGVPGTDHMWLWDVSKLTGKMLLEPLGLEPGELDLLHGSPPCQGFSISGKQDPMDPRNTLMLEYARLITEIQPKAFTLEQVPNVLNMTTADGQPMLEAFIDCITDSGYATRKALTKMLQMQGFDAAVLRRVEGRAEKAKAEKREEKRQRKEQEVTPQAQPSLFDMTEVAS